MNELTQNTKCQQNNIKHFTCTIFFPRKNFRNICTHNVVSGSIYKEVQCINNHLFRSCLQVVHYNSCSGNHLSGQGNSKRLMAGNHFQLITYQDVALGNNLRNRKITISKKTTNTGIAKMVFLYSTEARIMKLGMIRIHNMEIITDISGILYYQFYYYRQLVGNIGFASN